jgi:lipoyl(octanoyl) transferase
MAERTLGSRVPDGVLEVRRLGRTSYADAHALQEELVEQRIRGEIGDQLVLTEHEPVITLGRGADARQFEQLGLPVVQVERGGDATYHGPGQLVGYPLVDLRRRGGDVHAFLRSLERALLRTLGVFGIAGFQWSGRTGIWVDAASPRKIASIGIGVRRGITCHGFALNVALDLAPFDAIVPCATPGVRMTSIERERASPLPSVREVADVAALHLAAELDLRAPVESLVVSR